MTEGTRRCVRQFPATGASCDHWSAIRGATATTQEALTYSFDGRAGLGYLSQTTGNELGAGFECKGPVLRVDL